MTNASPAAEPPPPLTGEEPDTFVHHTITVRWPRIARRVIADNSLSAAATERVRALVAEIPDGPIRPLDDPDAPDEALWNEWIAPHEGQSWRACPWFFGETYFYRRLMEAVGHYRPGPHRGLDPFSGQKAQGYAESIDAIRTLARVRAEAPDAPLPRRALVRLLTTALWGNQADLSMWDADAEGPDHLGTGRAAEHLLADDTEAALDHLEGADRPVRVDVWADNAGFELATDLALVDGLLAGGWADRVVLHVKAHPTFVSDATAGDVHAALARLAGDEAEAPRALADGLRSALAGGRLRLADPFTWTSPLPARDFSTATTAELARTDLLLSKGDANYRRLLGDRTWAHTTPFEDVVAYLPAPVLALRTMKAEVAAGLTQAQVDRLNDEDPDWLVNGRWGVAQFAED
ncbi:MAG: damage-control phosphatase ARMT1 family protein [Salinibacter sp.]